MKLVQDDAGKVTSAIFEADGGYVQVDATKSVLLTMGGYTSNAEMLRACNPMVDRYVMLQYDSPNNVARASRPACGRARRRTASARR